MALFRPQAKTVVSSGSFGYLDEGSIYLDSGCQTLRPQHVQDAMDEYYREYNACGERVKYEWGRKVDEKVRAARQKLLRYSGKSTRDYTCAFTLNTTYGLNLLLSQLPNGNFTQIVTSEKEHNSVFLPSMTYAKSLGLKRVVLSRSPDGSLEYKPVHLTGSIVIVNSHSNIDGQALSNARQLADDIHRAGGILILDAAQTMGHDPQFLKDVDYDAACFSGHKMYGPSSGVVIVKRKLLELLNTTFIGGGMVKDVQLDSYTLLPEEPFTRLEPGLQNYAGIIGLSAAVDWLESYRPGGQKPFEYEQNLSRKLFEGLKDVPGLKLFNESASPIISFFSQKLDSHQLAVYLSAQDIMARSGFFCCHYYLDALMQSPPLLRLSLGLNNTPAQVDKTVDVIQKIIEGVK